MELWDVLDYDRNPTGRTHVRSEPMAEGDYHLMVDVWIQNDLGNAAAHTVKSLIREGLFLDEDRMFCLKTLLGA